MASTKTSRYEQAVRLAVAEVVNQLDQALDFHHLARHAAMSPFHFHRVFRGMLGETPLELHRRLRLERAAWLLLNTQQTVTHVAFGAGYETHEAFTRAFTSRFGCSPSAFRQRPTEAGVGCVSKPLPHLSCLSGLHFSPDLARMSASHLQLAKENGMDVSIIHLQQQRVATVAHVGPYNRISEAFAQLGPACQSAQLFGPLSAMVAIYYDDPDSTPEAELRSDAGMVVSPEAPIPPSLGETLLPAGRYAVTLHHGSYAGLGDTWARLMGQWLPQNNVELGQGHPFEKYLNTPGEVAEAELLTELYLPLAGD